MEVNSLSLIKPKEWRDVSVDDIRSSDQNALSTGPFGSSIGSRFFQTSGVPLIRGSNLAADGCTHLIEDNFVFVSETKATELSRSLVYKGDLIFTCWGTINQVGLISDQVSYSKYIISNKQMKLTPDPNKADSLFLFYLFSSDELQKQIVNQSIGTSVPGFNLGQLRSLRFSIPPLSEQKAITEALGDADALIDILEQLITKKRQVKQGGIQELLTGKRRLPGFSGEWKETTLGLSAILRAGINKPLSQMGSGVLYVTVQDLYSGTSIDADNLGRIQVSSEEIAAKSLKPGDIVFGKSSVKRDGIGYPSQFLGCTEPVVFSGFTFCARPILEVANASFLFYSLRWEKTRLWLIDNSQASAITNINQSIAERIPLLLPPLPEQTAIAEILSDMDAEIAALEGKLSKAREVKAGMMSVLLTGKIRLVESG